MNMDTYERDHAGSGWFFIAIAGGVAIWDVNIGAFLGFVGVGVVLAEYRWTRWIGMAMCFIWLVGLAGGTLWGVHQFPMEALRHSGELGRGVAWLIVLAVDALLLFWAYCSFTNWLDNRNERTTR